MVHLIVPVRVRDEAGRLAGGGEVVAAGGFHRLDGVGVGGGRFEWEGLFGGDALEEEAEGIREGEAHGGEDGGGFGLGGFVDAGADDGGLGHGGQSGWATI